MLRWILVERLLRPRPRDPDPYPATLATPAFPAPRAAPGSVAFTWVGHSTFLVQIGGRNILTDPMWGARASPATWAGPRRRVRPGIALAELPPIDAVVQSHNHYDHLDAATVRQLGVHHGAARWFVPLGLAPFLRRRGVQHVTELDWWEQRDDHGVTYTCAPAQHFSGRGPTDRNRTLWCSWGVATADRRVYFGGDSGLHPDFGVIGARYGPFDAALLPIGAYAPRWFMRPVHMNPEEAVSAYRALAGEHRAPLFVGMHWGTFRLTDEPLDEPPRRLRAAWAEAGLPDELLWVPAHGETRVL